MRAIAEIQVIPIGSDVSVRDEVQRAHELLTGSDLELESHATGTNVEGELDEILSAVKHVHETLHADGIVRLSTTVKLSTRTDKEPRLQDLRL